MTTSTTARDTRRSFTGTPKNPILTAADWPYPGAHRLQRRRRRASPTARRCSSAASRIAAATRTCAPRARRTASTAGSSTRSRRCCPIPRTIPRSSGASRTRASRSSRSSASTRSPTPRSARAAPASRSRSPRTSARFERCGLVMQPDDKDAALLPRRIDGSFALIHRPMHRLGRARLDLVLARSAQLGRPQARCSRRARARGGTRTRSASRRRSSRRRAAG